MNTCTYCHGEATHQFGNGKWCCSTNMNRCPEVKRRRALETKQSWLNPNRGQAGSCKAARMRRNNTLTFEEQESIIAAFRNGASVNYMRNATGRGVTILKRLLKQSGVEYDVSRARGKQDRMERATPDLFKRNSGATNSSMKRVIKQYELLPSDKCWECGLSEWLQGPLTLDLDHIDGDHNNNEISNLRFLCPNCHSETRTYRGKNNTGQKKISDEALLEALKDCKNIRQALIKAGLSPRGGNYARAAKLLLETKTQVLNLPRAV